MNKSQMDSSDLSARAREAMGRRLSEVRFKHSLSQADMAGKFGLSVKGYQNYEKGDREIPSSLLVGLHDQLGIDPLWVLMGVDAPELRWTGEKLDLVSDVVLKLETLLADSEYELSPERKAKLVVLLIQFSQNSKQVDEAKIADLLSLTA